MKEKDHVDLLIAKWKKECPQYDLAPVEIIGRAGRIMEHVDRALEMKFAEYGTTRASFDVLATLRRSGAPFRLLQRDLMRQLMRTSGSMSLRVDALEREGLVNREHAEDDRRATYVVLSTKGSRLLDQLIPDHLENENALLSCFSGRERSDLIMLLKKWLRSFEGDRLNADEVDLGLVILSSNISLRKRRATGLPDVKGLLIHSVVEGGRAALAGLRKGDLVTAIENEEVTGAGSIRNALRKGKARRKRVHLLRGSSPMQVSLDLNRN